FVGTLVALERATALRRWYGFFAPGLLGAGGILIHADAIPLLVGQLVLVAGSAAFVLVYVPLWRRRFDAEIVAQIIGTAAPLAGAILWAGGIPMDRVLPWLIVFLVLTIAAERVELAAITMGPRAPERLL